METLNTIKARCAELVPGQKASFDVARLDQEAVTCLTQRLQRDFATYISSGRLTVQRRSRIRGRRSL